MPAGERQLIVLNVTMGCFPPLIGHAALTRATGRTSSRAMGRTALPLQSPGRFPAVWLGFRARPGCRIRLHVVPACCPYLKPIKLLRGLTNRHITHKKHHATVRDFGAEKLNFLRKNAPRNWHANCNQVTDNFHVINPAEFRIVTRSGNSSSKPDPNSAFKAAAEARAAAICDAPGPTCSDGNQPAAFMISSATLRGTGS